MGGGRLMLAAASLAGALATAGCGGSEDEFAPAAEPAASPPLTERPAGDVLRIGGEVEGLAFDERTGLLAAVARKPGELSLIDGEELRVRRAVPVADGTRHLQMAAPGGPVLVPAQFEDVLVSVSLPGGRTTPAPVGESPHDAAAAGGRIFVGDEGGDTVSVVEDGEVSATLSAPVQPGAVEAAGGNVAVVAVAERTMAVYDAASLDLVAEIGAGIGPTHAVADGDRVYVADTQGDSIRVFDLGPGGEPEPGPVVPAGGRPYGMALDSRRDMLWITSTARNLVLGFDVSGDRPEEAESHPTVRQPNTVAVNERSGTVFVAGATRGEIQRITKAGGAAR